MDRNLPLFLFLLVYQKFIQKLTFNPVRFYHFSSSMCTALSKNRTKSNQRWMKLRTTVQLSSAIQKKPPLKREDSFLKRFSTRQIPETQVSYIHPFQYSRHFTVKPHLYFYLVAFMCAIRIRVKKNNISRRKSVLQTVDLASVSAEFRKRSNNVKLLRVWLAKRVWFAKITSNPKNSRLVCPQSDCLRHSSQFILFTYPFDARTFTLFILRLCFAA